MTRFSKIHWWCTRSASMSVECCMLRRTGKPATLNSSWWAQTDKWSFRTPLASLGASKPTPTPSRKALKVLRSHNEAS